MPLNDCLSLFPAQALNRQQLNAGWRMAIATLGEGEDRGFSRTDFDDDAWAPVPVPRLHGATSGNEAIWYRVRFPRPRHRQRTLLRFEGAFLVANVWLNGRLLGSHYGYFAPFSFDISSFLLEENVLAVCIEAPVETDLAAKRHLMGLFNDSEPILRDIKGLLESTQFTLGPPVAEFEERFARLCGARHAIGVGTGTDALFLSLKALGVAPGDEVIGFTQQRASQAELVLVEAGGLDDLQQHLAEGYAAEFHKSPEFYRVRSVDGVMPERVA